MYFMWIVIYFSGRYACLFWYKTEVAKAFLLHQWVSGCLGYNRFAASGIYHSWFRLVIWNKFAIQIIGFMTGLFYCWFYTAVLCHRWCRLDAKWCRLDASIVLCIVFVIGPIQPCPKSKQQLLIIGGTIAQSNQLDGMLQALLSSLFWVICNYW